MQSALISQATAFAADHAGESSAAVALKCRGRVAPATLAAGLVQLDARRSCAAKLPGFLSHAGLYFADTLCGEQATAEAVAAYHASLLPPGARLLDMTAGLGIDAFSAARAGLRVTAIEMDEARAEALEHNAAVLGLPLRVMCADSLTWLAESNEQFECIFIDPARRDSAGRRTYGLTDCTPDVTACLPLLLSRCPRLIIKASPLLDVSRTLLDLPGAVALRAVSLRGECKELLIEVEEGVCDAPLLEAVDINAHGEVSRYKFAACYRSLPVAYAEAVRPGMYLYEPSASVMKFAPAGGALQASFPSLRQLDVSTHLYVGEELIDAFPGRRLLIEAMPSGRELKCLKGERFNVVSRNHPLSPEQLARKYSVRAGDDSRFLYACRIAGKPAIIAAKII